MLDFTRGNLLKADAEAVVNTVNCVGVMGKGIALQFKQAYPEMFKEYERVCKAGKLQPGQLHVYETGSREGPRYIVNFPTKRHWRGKSKLEDIKAGLEALAPAISERGIRSIAIPPLGCGFGGLSWADVRPLIEAALSDLPNVDILVFEPGSSPPTEDRVVRTKRPQMTLARALYLCLMERYGILGYQRTLLEVQKLAYFLQESGEQLRLGFVEGHYGPYADNLNHVLRAFEGHFTQGYKGDRKPDSHVVVLEGAATEAHRFLDEQSDASPRNRLDRVFRLIEGFETPYGMELLATVHWVATKSTRPVGDLGDVVKAVQGWNDRKKRVFQPKHIAIAWERLRAEEWVAA